jgi:hypothetical protein
LELILRAYAKNTTTLLGTLTHASDKKIRVHFNGPGEGSFTINRHDSQAAWCAPGNYVRAYLNSTANPVFGFFLEDGGDELVSPDEEGGEDLTRHGRGPAAVLEDAIIDATGARYTKEGTWVWTDSTMGAIAANLIDDAQAAGFLPMLTYDFSSGADTNGASWDVFDGQYELPVGLDLLEAIQRLQSAGFIVRVSHDFVMSAYKTIGTDRSGTITFQAAVNISEAAEREIRGSAAKSRMLVQGTTRNGTLKFVWATDSAVETALGRPKAGFVNYAASASDTVLGRVGAQAIRRLKKRFDGLSSLGVLEDEFVPFTDYFPGDTVTIIVPGEYASLHVPVTAIGITEVDNGQAYVALEFEDVAFEPLQLKDRTDPTQSPSSGGGGGGADTGTGCNDCPPVAGETLQCLFSGYDDGWFVVTDIDNTHSLTSTSLLMNGGTSGPALSVINPVSPGQPYYNGLRQALTLNLAFTMSEPDTSAGTHDLQIAGIGVAVQFDGAINAGANWEWDPAPPDLGPPRFFTYLTLGASTSTKVETGFDGSGSITLSVSSGGCTASFDGHSLSVAGIAIESATGYIQPGVGFEGGVGTIVHTTSAGLLDIRNSGTEPWCTGTPAVTSGQAVTNEPATSGDGTTTTFSTQHPYMPGSLFVKVNGVNWTGDIATQDPTTGSFTFTHAPKAGADIVVDYRAA